MDKKILICIGLILLVFYFTSLVPYCKITEKEIYASEASYTLGETLEIKEIIAVLLNVKGTSMIPTIQDNSECLCVKKEKYEINDIIFFFADINGQFHGVTHRIAVINSEGIFTKGDNNDWIDPPMTKESIICAVPYVPRYKTLI